MCNVPANLYDNGDCCLASIVEHYCHNTEMKDISGDCVCHEDNTRHPGLEGKGVFSKPFLQCKCVQDSAMEHGVNLQLFWVRFVNVIGQRGLNRWSNNSEQNLGFLSKLKI